MPSRFCNPNCTVCWSHHSVTLQILSYFPYRFTVSIYLFPEKVVCTVSRREFFCIACRWLSKIVGRSRVGVGYDTDIINLLASLAFCSRIWAFATCSDPFLSCLAGILLTITLRREHWQTLYNATRNGRLQFKCYKAITASRPLVSLSVPTTSLTPRTPDLADESFEHHGRTSADAFSC